jgi:hypothetical protein
MAIKLPVLPPDFFSGGANVTDPAGLRAYLESVADAIEDALDIVSSEIPNPFTPPGGSWTVSGTINANGRINANGNITMFASAPDFIPLTIDGWGGSQLAHLQEWRGNSASAWIDAEAGATFPSLAIGAFNPPIKFIFSETAALNFPNTLAGTVSDLTVTVVGAEVGDVVVLGVPHASVAATSTYFGWVSALSTVTIRHSPNGVDANPAGGSFRVTVIKF